MVNTQYAREMQTKMKTKDIIKRQQKVFDLKKHQLQQIEYYAFQIIKFSIAKISIIICF